MIRKAEILKILAKSEVSFESGHTLVQAPRISRAVSLAKRAHRNQSRKFYESVVPYHVHPFQVATVLQAIGMPEDVVVAGICHDILEDTFITETYLRHIIGQTSLNLVKEVTNVSRRSDGNRRTRADIDANHLKKASPYGMTIKLADICCNLRSICEGSPSFAKVWVPEKVRLVPYLSKGAPIMVDIAQEMLNTYSSMSRT